MVDLQGALVRILFEAWLHGMWVLFEGSNALTRLNADYQRSVNLINERADLGFQSLDDTRRR